MNRLLKSHLGRPLSLVVALLSLALVLTSPGTANAAVRTPAHTVIKNDVGTLKSFVTGTTTRHRTVVGRFNPNRFVVQNGVLKAVGTLNVVTRGPGVDRHLVKSGVAIPVKSGSIGFPLATAPSGARGAAGLAAPAGSCQILDLVLGPLDLNLLGLNVHLDRVVLNIFATPGPGALLGNLLCAVAGLLDGTPLAGLLGQIATALNAILAALRAG
jgi:hypothetical protein